MPTFSLLLAFLLTTPASAWFFDDDEPEEPPVPPRNVEPYRRPEGDSRFGDPDRYGGSRRYEGPDRFEAPPREIPYRNENRPREAPPSGEPPRFEALPLRRVPQPDGRDLIEYRNPRYGFTVTYPPALFPRVEKDQKVEGWHVRSEDQAAEVIVSAGPVPAQGISLRNAFEGAVGRPGRNVTYKRLGDSYFVVSGFEKDKVFYLKGMVHDGTLLGLVIRHPATERARYGEATEQIIRSFRAR